MREVARRIALSLALLFAVSVVSFALLELAPGDFFTELQTDTRVGSSTVGALRTQYGLTQSPVTRYCRWLWSLAHGDLGVSLASRAPVSSVLWTRTGNTLLLTVPAMVFTWALALPLGLWTAKRRGRCVDRVCSGASSMLVALPDLLVGLMLLLLALGTGLFPAAGKVSEGAEALGVIGFLQDLASHAFLPLCALTVTMLPPVFRHVRASVAAAALAPSVRAARGHGISGSMLTLRYVLPMAANPLISLAGLSIATLLSTSLLIEVVMSWPGLGPLLVEALLAKDVHVVLSVSMLATTLLVIGNLLADLTLHAIDPRIQA